MSRLRSDYESTKWARFLGWVNGTLEETKSLEKAKNVEETTSLEATKGTEVLSKASFEMKQDEVTDTPTGVLDKVSVTDNQVTKHREDDFTEKSLRLYNRFYKLASVIVCMSIIGILLFTVSFLPRFGDASNPDNNEVTERYITQGLQETGAVNIVTGMILDYRAFDTFGESNVLYIAACSVLILLRLDSKGNKKSKEQDDAEENDRIYEPKNDVILQKVATMLVPPIIIFGIYVILNGHLSPGGGFSGGAIIGAGLILYLNAFGFKKTERFFTMKTFKGVTFGALSFYALSKSYSFFTGANHLESHIPLGTPGAILSSGLILPLNICVGLVVACTMYGFYALFRKGGM